MVTYADFSLSLKIVSFNMHGFNQGLPVVEDLIASSRPDVFMLQEHWLSPANLCFFETFWGLFPIWLLGFI